VCGCAFAILHFVDRELERRSYFSERLSWRLKILKLGTRVYKLAILEELRVFGEKFMEIWGKRVVV